MGLTVTFDLDVFNAGDYTRAVHQNTQSENLTKVLYPEDSTPQGKLLRLEQQIQRLGQGSGE